MPHELLILVFHNCKPVSGMGFAHVKGVGNRVAPNDMAYYLLSYSQMKHATLAEGQGVLLLSRKRSNQNKMDE